jgi:hydrogenase maturation protease
MSCRLGKKILVVAVGNPDRADDGVGALVGARLAGLLPPGVALVVRTSDILGLIEDWAGCHALVCVDAAAPRGTPGRVHRIDLATTELPPGESFGSSHAFGLTEAIAIARELHVLPETVVIYAVEGKSFDGGASMTPAVAAAADDVAKRIVNEVGRLARIETEAPRHA